MPRSRAPNPADNRFAEDVAAAVALLTAEAGDPWARRLILDTNILIAYERGLVDRATLDDDEHYDYDYDYVYDYVYDYDYDYVYVPRPRPRPRSRPRFGLVARG